MVGSPTIAASTGAGTSPTVTLIGSADAGSIAITTGSSPATTATIFTLKTAVTYSQAVLKLAPANDNAASAGVNITASLTGSTFTVTNGSPALSAATLYQWSYIIKGTVA